MDFDIKDKRPALMCVSCRKDPFFRFNSSYFSPGMLTLTGELICSDCINGGFIANGLKGKYMSQKEIELLQATRS